MGGPLVRAHQRAADLMPPSGACPHNCGYKIRAPGSIARSSVRNVSMISGRPLMRIQSRCSGAAAAAAALGCSRRSHVESLPSCGPVSFDLNKPPAVSASYDRRLEAGTVPCPCPPGLSELPLGTGGVCSAPSSGSHCLRSFPADEHLAPLARHKPLSHLSPCAANVSLT